MPSRSPCGHAIAHERSRERIAAMSTSDRLPPPNAASLGPGYHSPAAAVTVRLNTNESAVPPPVEFCTELAATVGELAVNRYPDRRATALREAIGRHHGVGADWIFCANGSNEVLQCLMLAYGGPGRAALVFEPTYALHAHIGRLTGTAVVTAERDEAFAVDPAEAAELLGLVNGEVGGREPTMTLLCSPNNPTGNAERQETVKSLAAAVPGLLVVDEAYAQFAPWSALELVAAPSPAPAGDGAEGTGASTSEMCRHENVVVVRTFSKTWAMAALRLGYLVADPAVVAACESAALPYHLDAIKQAAGILALRFEPEMRQRTADVVAERIRVEAGLRALGGTVWPSDANFLLFRLEGRDASEVWQALVHRSVLVRDVSAWARLEGCLRVTIGTPAENEAFLSALASVLEQPAPPVTSTP
jgi:histidinol-phosphate aminotransferase